MGHDDVDTVATFLAEHNVFVSFEDVRRWTKAERQSALVWADTLERREAMDRPKCFETSAFVDANSGHWVGQFDVGCPACHHVHESSLGRAHLQWLGPYERTVEFEWFCARTNRTVAAEFRLGTFRKRVHHH